MDNDIDDGERNCGGETGANSRTSEQENIRGKDSSAGSDAKLQRGDNGPYHAKNGVQEAAGRRRCTTQDR